MNYLNLLKEFRSLGCDNVALCSAACHLFIELIDVKKLHCVNYHYNEALKLIYMIASKVKKESIDVAQSSSQIVDTDGTDVYVPVMAMNDIDLNVIETIQRTLSKDNYRPNIILAIVDSNSTILYYRLTNGLLDLNNFDSINKEND